MGGSHAYAYALSCLPILIPAGARTAPVYGANSGFLAAIPPMCIATNRDLMEYRDSADSRLQSLQLTAFGKKDF